MAKYKVPRIKNTTPPIPGNFHVHFNIISNIGNRLPDTYEEALREIEKAEKIFTFETNGDSIFIKLYNTVLVEVVCHNPNNQMISFNVIPVAHTIPTKLMRIVQKFDFEESTAMRWAQLWYYLDNYEDLNEEYLMAQPIDGQWFETVSVPRMMKQFNLPLKATLAKLQILRYEIVNPEASTATFNTFG
jgi:hypothetical protein